MNCNWSERLGIYVDGELSPPHQLALEEHLADCVACRAELERMRQWARDLARSDETPAPAELWNAIEERLPKPTSRPLLFRMLRRPLAAAAGLALLLGAGILVTTLVNNSATTAQATTVDYSILLDGVATDVNAAVERFFKHYGAEPISVEQVSEAAPELKFNLPLELPGGFRLQQAYRLRFGATPGVAARYARGSEPLVMFFHSPMRNTQLGVHQESSCHVAGREGYHVEVGPWRLLHFTDPRTCHCLLSRLDEREQHAVMSAVALELSASTVPHAH